MVKNLSEGQPSELTEKYILCLSYKWIIYQQIIFDNI